MRKNRSSAALRRNFAILTVAIVATSEASFGQTWTGLAGDGLFSTSTNWSSTPVSGASTNLTFGGSAPINSTNNLGAFGVGTLTFNNSSTTAIGTDGTSSFNFLGTAPSIIVNGGGAVTISAPVNLAMTDSSAGVGYSLGISGTGTGGITFSGPVNDPVVAAAITTPFSQFGGTALSGSYNGVTQTSATSAVTFSGGGSLGFIAASKGTVNFTGGTYQLASANNPSAGPGLGAPSAIVALSAGNSNGSTGTINVDSGATVVGGNMYIGNFAGGTGILNVNGGTVDSIDNATSDANYGRLGVYGGTGYINISNGGVVNCRLFEGGRVNNSQTYLTVTGTGSALNCEQFLLGRGTNTQSVAVLNGAAINDLGTTGNNMLIADAGGVTSTVLVSGSGSSINSPIAAFMAITSTAHGTLTISNGATGNLTGGLYMGAGTSSANGGVATLLVDGSTFNCGAMGMGNGSTTAGPGATCTATFSNSSVATYSSSVFMGTSYGTLATINVLGGSTMNLTEPSGTTYFEAGLDSKTNCTVLVSGAGSSINVAGLTFFGLTGSATASLVISNGASGTFGQISLGGGGSAGGTGILTVDGSTLNGTLLLMGQNGTAVGTGSTSTATFQNGANATFASEAIAGDGYAANATVNVTGGSTLNLPDFTYNTFLAFATNSKATMTVSGGSTVTMGSGLTMGLGSGSTSTMSVSGGSTVTISGYLEIAEATNSVSSVTVTGSGSTLNEASSGDPTFLGLATGTTATMLISNGASGSFSQFSMGGGGSAAGTSILTVDNSSFSSTLFLMGQTGTGVGTGSTNTATFTNNATAEITSEMDIAEGYATLATLNISGGAIVDNSLSPYSVFASPVATATSFINVSTGGQFLATQLQLSTNGGAEGGPATLALSNGGTVTVSGGLFIGNLGTVTLTGGSVLTTGFVNYGTNTSIGHISIDATSTLLIQGTATGGAVMQDVISGSGLLEINSSGLTEYFDVSPFPFKGTIQANLGTFEEIFVPWSPNISNTASGAVQATGSGGSFIVATGTGTSYNGVPAQVGLWVHTVQAINGGLVQVSNTAVGSLAHVIVTDTVDVGPSGAYTGLIDLTNNDMIVRQSTLAAVTAQLAAYFNGGDTVGIGSSEAGQSTADSRDLIASLGVIQNDDGTGHALYTTFDGVTVTDSDVLIRYTYLGDTTLKGYVDSTDLANTLAGLNGGLTGWENGDFTYAGSVTEADVLIVLNALGSQGTPFGSSGGSGAVPEPTGLLLAAAGLPMLGRRRRA